MGIRGACTPASGMTWPVLRTRDEESRPRKRPGPSRRAAWGRCSPPRLPRWGSWRTRQSVQ
eukprot:11168405-Alexandrium_andersonii.AAC.1